MANSLKEHNFFGFDATIVADSINTFGDRLTTLVLTYPRIIHAEFMTHRMFSRNSASSRAIPYKKMVERVKSNPFIPIAWQKDHTGMQGTEYFTDEVDIQQNIKAWIAAMQSSVAHSEILSHEGITKQLCNRLLEPFLWHTVVVSATEWENFFSLRCPQYEVYGNTWRSKKDALNNEQYGSNSWEWLKHSNFEWLECNKSGADIHIQPVAEAMWDAMNESVPKLLSEGEWHIPFREEINLNKLYEQFPRNEIEVEVKDFDYYEKIIRKICTALCARLSYGNITADGDYVKDVALYDKLHATRHASPFEHCARTMSVHEYNCYFKGVADWYTTGEDDTLGLVDEQSLSGRGWCLNFRGFIQERALIGLQ